MLDHGKSPVERAKEGVSAGAAQAKNVAHSVADTAKQKVRDVASATKETAREAARIVREAEADNELKQRARSATEQGLERAGHAVSGAAPAIGRGAEYATTRVGDALSFIGRPLGVIIGAIAGTIGGWWNKASELRSGLPPEEEAACRTHFATLAVDGLAYEDARNGYALGFLAGGNPDYGGRAFEEIEPDLRHGFYDDAAEYDTLREFARFGFERGCLRSS
jgi:hypothetical protein